LQEEYSTNGGTSWTLLGSPLVATPNDYYGANANNGISHIPVVFDLTGVTGANNNPNLELRLVSSYDPTVLNSQGQPYEYTAATLGTGGAPVKYNGTSGNWRFGNFSIDAIPDWLSPASAYNATWNPANNTLTVTGSAVIDADPGSNIAISPTAEPNIVDSTAGSTVSVTPPTSSPIDIHIGGVELSNGADMVVTSFAAARTATNHSVLVIGAENATTSPTFSIDSSSKLDLEDNDMIIHNGNYSATEAMAQVGRNAPDTGGLLDGTWTGNELTSSAAATEDADQGYEEIALAVVENADLPFGQFSSWTVGSASEPLRSDGQDIIVKYTYVGDFTLDGAVDDAAATIMQAYYGGPSPAPSSWAYGDTNGDGTIDDTDATAFQVLYGNGVTNGPAL
jgi:hypothetical protein